MSPQTKVVYRKRAEGIGRAEPLTGYGTGHRQQVWLTREQICRPLQDIDRLLFGQPPLREEMAAYEIEVWYRGPVAIVEEKLVVRGLVCGWMGDIFTLAFRVFWLVLE